MGSHKEQEAEAVIHNVSLVAEVMATAVEVGIGKEVGETGNGKRE